MQITNAATTIIRHFEGLKLKAYKCPAGIWTIGYGHTGPDVHEGLVITQARAVELLLQDVKSAVKAVNDLVKMPLTQGQFDALVSFTYNLGRGNLESSTLLKLINAGRFDAAAGEFAKWVMAKGKKLDGLVKRRAAEAFLFKTSLLPVLS